MGYLGIGSKAALGMAAGTGLGYAGFQATSAGYTTPGMATMGAGVAIGAGSLGLGKRAMTKHYLTRSVENAARGNAKAAKKLHGQADRRFFAAKAGGAIGLGAAGYRIL